MEMAIIRGLHWGIILVQDIEPREALLVEVYMLRIIEDLRYVLLVVSKIGSFM